MSYQTLEESAESAPIELYEFQDGADYYRYTTDAETVLFQGNNFYPASYKRSRIRQNPDPSKNDITFVTNRTDVFASKYLAFPPENVILVTVYRYQEALPAEVVSYWKGRVVGFRVSGNEITITCESIFTSVKRPGLRARYQYDCRHALFSSGCGLSRESWKVSGMIDSVDGRSVVVAAAAGHASGYFNGGFLWVSGVGYRMISSHSGSALSLTRPMQRLAAGQPVYLWPGCSHTKAECINKFNNIVNFGGFPWIPRTNIFTQSLEH